MHEPLRDIFRDVDLVFSGEEVDTPNLRVTNELATSASPPRREFFTDPVLFSSTTTPDRACTNKPLRMCAAGFDSNVKPVCPGGEF